MISGQLNTRVYMGEGEGRGGEGRGGEGEGGSLIANPEKVQLIQPPRRIIGRTFMNMFFIMSVAMLLSVSGTHAHTHRHTSHL